MMRGWRQMPAWQYYSAVVWKLSVTILVGYALTGMTVGKL